MIEKINKILNIDDSYKAPERVMNMLYNKKEREKVCKELLKLFNNDVSCDWFREYYEQEQAERKTKKQDFTPQCVTELVSKIVGNKAPSYDCCSGTGGITISKWYNDCLQENPFSYNPAEHLYVCEELSDRATPFLLLNLIIRGMNAIVIQCDVLTRQCKGIFFIYNQKNDFLKFSDFNVMPYSTEVEQIFNVNFTDNYYKPHIESELMYENKGANTK